MPENILGSVCSEWLSVSDFCRLGTAMSDRQFRAWLRSAVESKFFVWPELDIDAKTSHTAQRLRWIAQKKLKFTNITYSDSENEDKVGLLTAAICVAQGDVLRSLDMGTLNASVDDDTVVNISRNCTNLTTVRLSGGDECRLTEASVIALAENCPHITSWALEIWKYDNFNLDVALSAISRHSTNLQMLSISQENDVEVRDVSVDFVSTLTSSSLTNVSLECVGNIDALVPALAQRCRLQVLKIRCCDDIADAAITSLCDNCSATLRQISFYLLEMSSWAFEEIATRCTALTHISFKYCPSLTDNTLSILTRNCRHLTHLEIIDHDGVVSDSGYKCIGQHCPQLLRLKVGGHNTSAESVLGDAERYALSDECKLEILAGCPLLSSIDLVLYSMKDYF